MLTIFCPRISRIFVQASAEPNLFELCREQPKMSKKSTRISCFAFNGDLFGRTNRTNAMREHRGRSCGVVPSRHIGLASPFRGLRPRLPSLRSVVPSRHVVLASPFRALRTRLLSLRSVVPSRHLTHNSPNKQINSNYIKK